MTTSPAFSVSRELVERVAANLADVRRRITSTGRELDSVRIVAVTKTFGVDVVHAAAEVGLTTVAENYVDEMESKRGSTRDLALRWHYLGSLQSNKIARAAKNADVLCGVSRSKELDRIARERPGMSIYVQVDFTDWAQRNGVAVSDAAELVERGRQLGLDVRGLMTVAAPERDAARRAFLATDELCRDLDLVERSMGMSDDLEVACECATSEVRVGRALFGPRKV
jgi:uncharacterized pyridoxal phosphate-containing UPF0001 family protein